MNFLLSLLLTSLLSLPLISAKPEARTSFKRIPESKIVDKACRGELYEAYAMTDKVPTALEREDWAFISHILLIVF